MNRGQTLVRWYTVRDAAEALGLTPEALRKQIERRKKRTADGGTEAVIDGVRARKFGRLWRVSFGTWWME